MAITVVRNQKESPDRLISRFHKKIQASRLLNKVRDSRYFKKKKTKRKVRAGAVKREEYRAKRRKMQYY